MKRIAIIELDYHAEVLRNLCIYLEDSNFMISIFTTEKIWKQVQIFENPPSNFSVYLKLSGQSSRYFLDQHLSVINNSDLIVFNTIASNFRYFNKHKFSPPTIARIHNLNATFGKSLNYQPKLSLFYLWKDFSFIVRKLILKSEWYYKKKFLKNIDYFMFPDKIITEVALKQENIPNYKIIRNPIPFAHYEGLNDIKEFKENHETIIGIIGSVDQRRRDYELIYSTFKAIAPILKNKVQLVLLGSSTSRYGKKIIGKLSELNNQNFETITFNGFVEEVIFRDWIKKIDFLILPLNADARYTIYSERYGYTKISGNINDIIKYGKPAILPETYPTSDITDKLVEKYEDKKNLISICIDWIQNQEYRKKSKVELKKEFSLKQVQQRTIDTFNSVIQK